MVPVDLATEGPLDEAVLRRLIELKAPQLIAAACLGKQGRDHLLRLVPALNAAATYRPTIVLADLERDACPPALLQTHLPNGPHGNLRFRIAERAIESWLLANRFAFAEFLAVPVAWLPERPDLEPKPKTAVIRLARRSRRRNIREELVPPPHSTSRVGPNYVGRLAEFASGTWDLDDAATRSESLRRAIVALGTFRPVGSGGVAP